jgi:O-methyltransferase
MPKLDVLRQLFVRQTAGPTSRTSQIARQVSDARLTYLKHEKIVRIEQALADVAERGVEGCFVECGVALGGSGIIIATLMPGGREFHGYDVFGMIPPPTSEKDDEKSKARYEAIRTGQSRGIGGDPYYGYVDDLYERVVDNFARFGQPVDGRRVALHKGYFQDTLHPASAIAFAHIDCDWYDPVKLCLERIVPCLSEGAYVVLDDYNDYGGCRTAVDEFLAGNSNLDVIARTPNFVFRRPRPTGR